MNEGKEDKLSGSRKEVDEGNEDMFARSRCVNEGKEQSRDTG